MISIKTIEQAQERIGPYVFKTPLIPVVAANTENPDAFLKCENFQRTRSFKIRGAMNRLLTLSEQQTSKGVITRSSGNFAQAVAYAGSILDIATTIVMPTNALDTKITRTRQFGAEIILHGTTAPEGDSLVDQLASQRSLTKLSPYNDYEVMAGQGTAALEIFDELDSIDAFFCPIGGGGLLSGASIAIRARFPECKIYGVEPAGADDYAQSREQHRHVKLDSVSTIADGLRPPSVGSLAYPILNEFVDQVLRVSDDQILEAMAFMEAELGILVEPSGAAALAGLTKAVLPADSVAVALISGGNRAQK